MPSKRSTSRSSFFRTRRQAGSRLPNGQGSCTPVKLFYSYSHKDEALRDELETHLSGLKRQGLIEGWHDRKIAAGADWPAPSTRT